MYSNLKPHLRSEGAIWTGWVVTLVIWAIAVPTLWSGRFLWWGNGLRAFGHPSLGLLLIGIYLMPVVYIFTAMAVGCIRDKRRSSVRGYLDGGGI